MKPSVVLLAIALLLTGCVSGEVPSDIATYVPQGEGSDAALLRGILTRFDGCVYVATEEGDRYLPVFPDDARWADDILTSGRHAWSLDEPGEFGGGEGRLDNATVPEACDVSLPVWQVST